MTFTIYLFDVVHLNGSQGVRTCWEAHPLKGWQSPQGLAIPSTVTVMATAMNSEYVLHSECVVQ